MPVGSLGDRTVVETGCFVVRGDEAAKFTVHALDYVISFESTPDRKANVVPEIEEHALGGRLRLRFQNFNTPSSWWGDIGQIDGRKLWLDVVVLPIHAGTPVLRHVGYTFSLGAGGAA